MTRGDGKSLCHFQKGRPPQAALPARAAGDPNMLSLTWGPSSEQNRVIGF